MPSGMDRGRDAALARSPLVASVAALLALAPIGCAQLQTNWSDRLAAVRGDSRPTAPPTIRSSAAPPSSPAGDPYAARVGLGDRTPASNRAWTPSRAGGPPPGAMAPPESIALPAPPPIPPPDSSPELLAAVPPAVPPPENPGGGEPGPSTHFASNVSSPAAEPAPAAAEPTTAATLDAIGEVVGQGVANLEAVRNYRVTLDRQERVRGALLDPEQVTLSVRTEPFAVRLEWPGGPNNGREVLYSEAECGGLMHVKMGKTLIPLPPMQLAPDSPLALSNARHPITEAGLLHILVRIRDQIAAARAGDAGVGVFSLIGPLEPGGSEAPSLEILRDAPDGERWRLVVDQQTSLPILLEATDAAGALLERYGFSAFQPDLAELDEPGAFDPAVRFGRPVVRASATAEGTTP